MNAVSGPSVEDSLRWFVVQTHWRQETLAVQNLRAQRDRRTGLPLFEAYLPMHQQVVRPKGQPARVVSLPFFPRYLFALCDVGAPGWTALYSTRGVCGVLPTCNRASARTARLVADLRQAEVAGFLKLSLDELPCRWKDGDSVAWGAWRDAIFRERVDERRARIAVSGLFGTDSFTVDVDLAELEDGQHNGVDIESRVVR